PAVDASPPIGTERPKRFGSHRPRAAASRAARDTGPTAFAGIDSVPPGGHVTATPTTPAKQARGRPAGSSEPASVETRSGPDRSYANRSQPPSIQRCSIDRPLRNRESRPHRIFAEHATAHVRSQSRRLVVGAVTRDR